MILPKKTLTDAVEILKGFAPEGVELKDDNFTSASWGLGRDSEQTSRGFINLALLTSAGVRVHATLKLDGVLEASDVVGNYANLYLSQMDDLLKTDGDVHVLLDSKIKHPFQGETLIAADGQSFEVMVATMPPAEKALAYRTAAPCFKIAKHPKHGSVFKSESDDLTVAVSWQEGDKAEDILSRFDFARSLRIARGNPDDSLEDVVELLKKETGETKVKAKKAKPVKQAPVEDVLRQLAEGASTAAPAAAPQTCSPSMEADVDAAMKDELIAEILEMDPGSDPAALRKLNMEALTDFYAETKKQQIEGKTMTKAEQPQLPAEYQPKDNAPAEPPKDEKKPRRSKEQILQDSLDTAAKLLKEHNYVVQAPIADETDREALVRLLSQAQAAMLDVAALFSKMTTEARPLTEEELNAAVARKLADIAKDMGAQ